MEWLLSVQFEITPNSVNREDGIRYEPYVCLLKTHWKRENMKRYFLRKK